MLMRCSPLLVRALLAACLLLSTVFANGAEANADLRVSDLLRVHDLRTSVAFSNRFLKQQALVAVRDVLTRIGRERQLGAGWKRGNLFWDQAEQQMAKPLIERVSADWSSLGWLPPQWNEMGRESFSATDVDQLLQHFGTDVGRKQARIIDHSVAFHVSGAYGLSGRFIQDYPGTEVEQKALTYVWDEEDREMRFSIEASENIEGQRFALSALGAKYQKTLIVKLTGMLNARIDQVAASLPAEARSVALLADPFVTNFRAAAQ